MNIKTRLFKGLCLVVGICVSFSVTAQYYLRGEITDENNKPLQNVKIFLPLKNRIYYTGASGGFGISTAKITDSLLISLQGYENKGVAVRTNVYQRIVLKILPGNVSKVKPRRASVTKNLDVRRSESFIFGDESYSNLIENEFVNARLYPSTGFALRIDKASYSNVRRFINQQRKPPKDAVRIEEMLNYFNFNYKPPAENQIFNIESTVTSCPWETSDQLLFINVSARKLKFDSIPPGNFVFLIDVSGSMDMPNRLPLLKEAFMMLVKNLRSVDQISIVTYGGTVNISLPPTKGSDKEKIIEAIEQLTASGDTPGSAGIKAAYQIAKSSFIPNGNNRIILATDGDFNVGVTSDNELEEMITRERLSGVKLTCLGVGMGNYKDSKIEILAKRGNGNFAYIDDISEAEKVLVKELTLNLYTVAKDVYLNVDFLSAYVKNYRLIGYDNKRDVLSDTISQLEGGEVGSANSTTAIFQINRTNNLPICDSSVRCPLAVLTLHYKDPADTTEKTMVYDCIDNFVDINKADPEIRFASAIAMFGLLSRQSNFIEQKYWKHLVPFAASAVNPDSFLQRRFLLLADKAKTIFLKKKKRKKDNA
ncbi:hypothetical protein BH09BAC2_BH09BAC2_22390 [soil metagenome]